MSTPDLIDLTGRGGRAGLFEAQGRAPSGPNRPSRCSSLKHLAFPSIKTPSSRVRNAGANRGVVRVFRGGVASEFRCHAKDREPCCMCSTTSGSDQSSSPT
eukprot:1866405-Rhodomonas_salina.2